MTRARRLGAFLAGLASLAAGLSLVFVAVIVMLGVSLATSVREDARRAELTDRVEPFGSAVDRLRADVLALVALAGTSETPADSALLDALQAEAEANAGRLVALAPEGFRAEAEALADQARDVLAEAGTGGPGAATRITGLSASAAVLRARADARIAELRDDITGLENTERTTLVAGSTVGAIGVIVVLLLAIGQDRERRRIARERSRFNTIIDASGAGVYQVDELGRIEFVNPAAERLLGYASWDLRGRSGHSVLHHTRPSGEPCPEWECALMRVLETGEPYTGTERFIRANGEYLPVEVSSAPILLDGRPGGAVVVFQDITDAERRREIQEDFASLASHELRTPLTSVVGFARLLRRRVSQGDGRIGEDGREAIEALEREAERMVDTVSVFLDLAQLTGDSLRLHAETLDLAEIAAEEVAAAARRYPDVTFDLEAGERPHQMTTDAERVKHVLANLLSNAAKYGGDARRVVVTVGGDADTATVTVRDFGPGVRPEDQPRIFDRFYRRREPGGVAGLGLGLFISREMTRALGGDLRYVAADGPGARFELRLPRAGVMPGVDRPQRARETPKAPTS